uniref:Cytochrome c biogenesis protein CcsA n=1 Tax=Gastoniella chaerophylla TaxID=170708 RepID=A0A3G5CS52_9MONI|nr:cytochrome c heme attachment protein [Gastoniella chaerophylla]AYW15697.1 cytochrome c heme attachment protein [Gastoniella chaerophylla]
MMYTHIDHIFVHTSFVMLLIVTLPNPVNSFQKVDRLNHFSKNGIIIAFFRSTGSLAIRYFQTKHLPLGNLYESLMFLSWSFSLLYLISNIASQNDLSGAVLAPSATLTHAFATSSLPQKLQESTALVPALQSQWLMTHVSTTTISYAILLCGSLLAIVLLSLFYGEVSSYSAVSLEYNSKYTKQDFSSNCCNNSQKQTNLREFLYSLFSNSRKCQLVNFLDKWAYRAISLGFSFLTIGLLSGAVWANEAWGSYWSWDPKETWALVTRLVYAIYLHTRIDREWIGEGPAAAASMGFFSVWICFLGVNLLGVGLHTYGWLV